MLEGAFGAWWQVQVASFDQVIVEAVYNKKFKCIEFEKYGLFFLRRGPPVMVSVRELLLS